MRPDGMQASQGLMAAGQCAARVRPRRGRRSGSHQRRMGILYQASSSVCHLKGTKVLLTALSTAYCLNCRSSMGSAVTMGKAWHAHTMRTYLCRHDSPKFFAPRSRKEGGQPGSFGAPALAAWVSPGLAPPPVWRSPAKRSTKIGNPQQGCIIPGHRRDVWEGNRRHIGFG